MALCVPALSVHPGVAGTVPPFNSPTNESSLHVRLGILEEFTA